MQHEVFFNPSLTVVVPHFVFAVKENKHERAPKPNPDVLLATKAKAKAKGRVSSFNYYYQSRWNILTDHTTRLDSWFGQGH